MRGFKKGHRAWNKNIAWSEKWRLEQAERTRKAWTAGKHKNNPTSKGTQSTRGMKMPQLTGSNNGNYKHGLYPLAMKIRRCDKYKLWRAKVFERDNYTCQDCGISGVYIEADHIKGFAKIMIEYNINTFSKANGCSALWDIKNGRTLCVSCHKLRTHKGGGVIHVRLGHQL